MPSYIELSQVKKTYKTGNVDVVALECVDFALERGELSVIIGPSGAGKTTVLNILGGMDMPTSGSVFVDGADIASFSEKKLTLYRRHDIGFVFQFFNLVQNLTALENVEMAAQICVNPLPADELLEQVGLGHRLNNFPAQLSGGEQQRVAIARAMAKNPKLLLCDEPTGALDDETGRAVLRLLQANCRDLGMTVVLITHNQAIAPIANHVVRMRSGRVADISHNAVPADIDEIEW